MIKNSIISRFVRSVWFPIFGSTLICVLVVVTMVNGLNIQIESQTLVLRKLNHLASLAVSNHNKIDELQKTVDAQDVTINGDRVKLDTLTSDICVLENQVRLLNAVPQVDITDPCKLTTPQ